MQPIFERTGPSPVAQTLRFMRLCLQFDDTSPSGSTPARVFRALGLEPSAADRQR